MENNDLFKETRNSNMLLNETYFWTDTVKDWKSIFSCEKYKTIILGVLKELVRRRKIVVYAFVIMPNHVHLVWKMLEKNGKEMPHASFNKYSAHKIFEDLKINHQSVLSHFKVFDQERKYRLWQRDPLAILVDSIEKVEQKIEYIHFNPLQEKWNLVSVPEDYFWSSAKFYETGIDDHGFLTDYREEF